MRFEHRTIGSPSNGVGLTAGYALAYRCAQSHTNASLWQLGASRLHVFLFLETGTNYAKYYLRKLRKQRFPSLHRFYECFVS